MAAGRVSAAGPGPRLALDAVRAGSAATGTGRFARRVLHELAAGAAGGTQLVVRVPPGDPELEGLARAAGGRVVRARGGRLARHLPWTAERADVAFSFANLHAAGPPAGRTVVAALDLAPLVTPWYHPNAPRRALRRHVAERALARADAYIVLSEFVAGELVARRGVDRARVTVVPLAPALDVDPAAPSSGLEAVRERHRLPERFLLTSGGSDPRKNVAGVVAAHARLRGAPPLAVVGGRWHGRPFPAPLRGADVRFLGAVSDAELAALLTLAEAFVFLSLHEGFGLPPLEAMALGTPVVCSATTALPEVVGDAGVLVDPQDAEGVAGELDALLGDERRRADLAGRGRERAARYSWTATAHALLAALVSPSPPRG